MNQNTSVLNIYDALINVIYLVYQLQYQVFQCLRLLSLVFSDSTFYHEPPRQEKLYEGKLL